MIMFKRKEQKVSYDLLLRLWTLSPNVCYVKLVKLVTCYIFYYLLLGERSKTSLMNRHTYTHREVSEENCFFF